MTEKRYKYNKVGAVVYLMAVLFFGILFATNFETWTIDIMELIDNTIIWLVAALIFSNMVYFQVEDGERKDE